MIRNLLSRFSRRPSRASRSTPSCLLESLESRTLLSADLAGNTLATARAVSLTATATTFADSVGSTDTNDYYSFTLVSKSNFSLALTGLSADADVQLLSSTGAHLATSQRPGTSTEAIAGTLNAGSYYIRVYPYSGTTNYNLTVSAAPIIADTAGSTRTAARDLGTLSATATTVTEYVGSDDPTDVFKFTLASDGKVSLGLTNLAADADLRLYDSTDALITSSLNSGTTAESITTSLIAGTYYAQVSRYSGNTTYSLTLSATSTTPTPDPFPTPTPTAATIVARTLTSLTELDITGSTGNDTILVTQSGSTLSITANGRVTTYGASSIGELAIWGGDGNDTITVDSSVTLNTRIYGGAGSDTLTDRTTGRATIVAIGGGADTLTGNGTNTSFWFDSTDTANTTTADVSAGRVHRVSSFYQPYTTNTSSSSYVSLELNGQNLTDPSDSGTTIRFTNRSLWGTSPTTSDVNQGNLGDCYLLATLDGLANNSTARLMETAVDLGDGTYAVQFFRNGVATYVRVDGDFASTGSALEYNATGTSGNIWASVIEKAYAVFATSSHTYAAIEGGLMSTVFTALGIANTTVNPATTAAATLYTYISTALTAGHAVTLGTIARPTNAPVVGGHAYTVISASRDAYGNITYVVRNPWGIDGAANASNLNDGLVTITAAQLTANFDLATWASA